MSESAAAAPVASPQTKPQLRPSGPPPASQRRTGSVVIRVGIGRTVTTLPTRRRPLANGKRFSRRIRRGVPGMTLCGRPCVAGWSQRHNVKPGTSRCAVPVVSCHGVGHGHGRHPRLPEGGPRPTFRHLPVENTPPRQPENLQSTSIPLSNAMSWRPFAMDGLRVLCGSNLR